LAGAVSVALIAVSFLWPKGMEVVFLDVGQGDGAFIRTCSGKTILIDGVRKVLEKTLLYRFYWIMV